MQDARLDNFAERFRSQFAHRQSILTFSGYLQQLVLNPRRLIRNSANYLVDMFRSTGHAEVLDLDGEMINRFRVFDDAGSRTGRIVRGERVQNEIFRCLESFVRQGFSNKLILLHGPNGSAKSSTIEAIATNMRAYSEKPEGAVYTFSWIFPVDQHATPHKKGETGPIGFGYKNEPDRNLESFALLDEGQIASKIPSEFRDNPVYLLPQPFREQLLRLWISQAEGIPPEQVELPPHALISGLSKRNQQIFENLLSGYGGDLNKVYRHVQVERFFYSRQYRIGISAVEPQMSIDAYEKQLTMDSNITNIPLHLQNIRLHEAFGPLVEANRGILEFSDMLKRPLETFKYLLNCVETGSINLPTSTAVLDIVFLATANEKHLDAFKTTPDFTSFRERFDLITVPYLLNPTDEEEIYRKDVDILSKSIKVCPHSVRLLCVWAAMTRLKKPDPESYESKHRPLIARLSPRDKINLIEGKPLSSSYSAKEIVSLKELRGKIIDESSGMVVYEGRFGASPREVRAILYRAGHNSKHETITPMAIFDELKSLVKDRTVYEFLQFEPRGKYHDCSQFIRDIEEDFVKIFEHELLLSMSLVSEEEYETLLRRYIDHAVADVKKEKIYNQNTSQYEAPSQKLMEEIEKIISPSGVSDRHREELLNRIAAFKLDNPKNAIDIPILFSDLLRKIQNHYYNEKHKIIQRNFEVMILFGSPEEKNLSEKERSLAIETYDKLENRFGYDRSSSRACLQFLLTYRKNQPS